MLKTSVNEVLSEFLSEAIDEEVDSERFMQNFLDILPSHEDNGKYFKEVFKVTRAIHDITFE